MSKPKFEDWKLERYRLGEASPDDARAIAAAALEDEELRARLAALEADDRATLAAHPPAQVAHRVRVLEREAARTGPSRRALWAPAFALAAAVAIGVVVVRAQHPDDDVLRPKGDGPTLRLFRLADPQPERLDDGAHVRPHDVVQVAFDLQGAPYAVVASVDGAGHATLHWPASTRPEATRVPAAFKTLPQSFELDEAPGFERFFLVTADAALDPEEVLRAVGAAARNGSPALSSGATWRSLLLDKTADGGLPR